MVNDGVETWRYILRKFKVCSICRSYFLLLGKKEKIDLLPFKSYLSCNETRTIGKHENLGGILSCSVGTVGENGVIEVVGNLAPGVFRPLATEGLHFKNDQL